MYICVLLSYPSHNFPVQISPNIYLTQLYNLYLFFFTLCLYVQLVLFICAWIWGHSLEHKQPTSSHTIKEN